SYALTTIFGCRLGKKRSSNKSFLLYTVSIGIVWASNSFSISNTVACCCSYPSLEASTTCNKKSASLTSSNVDLKEAIRDVGKSCKKPTVSVSKHLNPEGKFICLVNGSN